MAGIAGSDRHDMTGRLSGRIEPIMTSRTNPRNAFVVETCSCPRQGPMAILTNEGGLGVPDRFPHGLNPIMAVDTTTEDRRMIDSRGDPGSLKVAILALVGAPDMRWAPAGITANSAAVVADRTTGGRPLKEACHMAVLAGHPLVATG